MAYGITPLGDILARARAAALQGGQRMPQPLASVEPSISAQPASQQPETRARKKRYLIQVEDDPVEEEREELRGEPAPVLGTEIPTEKRAKTGSGRAELRSSLGNDASTLAFITGACQKMVAKYSCMVDLVKSPGYLQSCIEAQIEVRVWATIRKVA